MTKNILNVICTLNSNVTIYENFQNPLLNYHAQFNYLFKTVHTILNIFIYTFIINLAFLHFLTFTQTITSFVISSNID